MNRDSSIPVLLLYTMSGFTGLLAEQGLEKYTTLLVGATASASAVVLFTYLLGIAVGGFVAAQFLRRGFLRRSLRAYGWVELTVGIACAVFSYAFHPAMAALAPLQNLLAGNLGRQVVRFACGLTSPRMVTFGQTLDRSPITTSPMTWALGSTYADAAIVGQMPR